MEVILVQWKDLKIFHNKLDLNCSKKLTIKSDRLSHKHRLKFDLWFCWGFKNGHLWIKCIFESIQLSRFSQKPMMLIFNSFGIIHFRHFKKMLFFAKFNNCRGPNYRLFKKLIRLSEFVPKLYEYILNWWTNISWAFCFRKDYSFNVFDWCKTSVKGTSTKFIHKFYIEFIVLLIFQRSWV